MQGIRGDSVMRTLRSFISVLPLAGMEVGFFSAACAVLCFRSAAETVLIAHGCFGCYWTVLALC